MSRLLVLRMAGCAILQIPVISLTVSIEDSMLTVPGIDFPFELNSALQQCRHVHTFTVYLTLTLRRPYVFSGYNGAIQPVTIVVCDALTLTHFSF